jgi:hypothetical protein
MLEDREIIGISETVYRLANSPRLRAALTELGMDVNQALETIDFLQATPADDVSVLLTSPFAEPNGDYRPNPTRFSDGTWRVFYSA